MQWIFDKWEDHQQPLDVDVLDHKGYTPLYLACQKGFLGAEGIDSKSPEVMKKRRETVEILIKRKADVNHISPKLRMTPLHWAAYHGDPLLI